MSLTENTFGEHEEDVDTCTSIVNENHTSSNQHVKKYVIADTTTNK